MDGSAAKNGDGKVVAVIGVWWDLKVGARSQSRSIGEKSSQYAELAAVLLALRQSVSLSIQELIICSDSAYVCNVFLRYLATWKKNALRNAKGQLVKNAFLICAIDKVIHDNRITVYWKKVKGHSVTGPDKEGNDKADELARTGMQSGELWEVDETESVDAFQEIVTEVNVRAVTKYNLYPDSPDSDFVEAQKRDQSISKMRSFLQQPGSSPTEEELASDKELKIMYVRKKHFVVEKDLLLFTKEIDGKVCKYVVIPKSHRSTLLWHTHDHPVAGHRGVQNTYGILARMVYWPNMFSDVSAYVERCVVCCKHLPKSTFHRAPLRPRISNGPWSEMQIDFVGPLVKSRLGNKYILVAIDTFSKYVSFT